MDVEMNSIICAVSEFGLCLKFFVFCAREREIIELHNSPDSLVSSGAIYAQIPSEPNIVYPYKKLMNTTIRTRIKVKKLIIINDIL